MYIKRMAAVSRPPFARDNHAPQLHNIGLEMVNRLSIAQKDDRVCLTIRLPHIRSKTKSKATNTNGCRFDLLLRI